MSAKFVDLTCPLRSAHGGIARNRRGVDIFSA